MRKPNIGSLRERKFTDAVANMKHKPNASIIVAIDSKIFALDGNRVFRYKPEVLALQEYQRCHDLLERRIPQAYNVNTQMAMGVLGNIAMSVHNSIITKEMRFKRELETIAVDTIREMFSIPEHINILPNLSGELGNVEEQDDSPESILSLTPERQKEIEEQIEKKVILNGIVHGCAMHIWKTAHYLIKEKIDEIDSSLMEMYNIFTAATSWMLWQMDPDAAMNQIDSGGVTQGKNEIKFEGDDVNIECEGINFPVLLHEVAKGAIDYLICHGIPEDFTEDELKYYYAKSDSYRNEYFHYLLSPSLWTSLIEAAGVNSQELPEIIMGLSKLNYDKLSLVMTACIDGPEEGAKKLKEFRIL